jgi:hypothetical protein
MDAKETVCVLAGFGGLKADPEVALCEHGNELS